MEGLISFLSGMARGSILHKKASSYAYSEDLVLLLEALNKRNNPLNIEAEQIFPWISLSQKKRGPFDPSTPKFTYTCTKV